MGIRLTGKRVDNTPKAEAKVRVPFLEFGSRERGLRTRRGCSPIAQIQLDKGSETANVGARIGGSRGSIRDCLCECWDVFEYRGPEAVNRIVCTSREFKFLTRYEVMSVSSLHERHVKWMCCNLPMGQRFPNLLHHSDLPRDHIISLATTLGCCNVHTTPNQYGGSHLAGADPIPLD